MAFIDCTSMPSSCQYDQISSVRHGMGELVAQDAEAVLGQFVVDAGEHRALERHVPHLVADQGEVGQGGVRRSVHGLQVFVPQTAQMDLRADATDDQVEVAPVEVEVPERNTAINHHEGFGRHLQEAIGLGVGERQEPFLAQPVELFQQSHRFELVVFAADLFATQDEVHEPEVVVE